MTRTSSKVAALLLAAACGGGEGGAPTSTSCGEVTCDSTQICVIRTPVGPGETASCEPVPASCESDRTCDCAATLCTGAFDACSERDELNTIVCACLQCQ